MPIVAQDTPETCVQLLVRLGGIEIPFRDPIEEREVGSRIFLSRCLSSLRKLSARVKTWTTYSSSTRYGGAANAVRTATSIEGAALAR